MPNNWTNIPKPKWNNIKITIIKILHFSSPNLKTITKDQIKATSIKCLLLIIKNFLI